MKACIVAAMSLAPALPAAEPLTILMAEEEEIRLALDYMIYAPGVSNADIGRPGRQVESSFALPVVFAGYSGGTRTAYIIVMAAPAH